MILHHELGRIRLGQLSLSLEFARRGQAGAWSGTPSEDMEDSSADITGALVAGLKVELLLLTGRLRLSSLDLGEESSMPLALAESGEIVCRGELGG